MTPNRIVSADPAIRDHVFTTHKPVIFQEACREARELAKMRRSEKIILVPNRPPISLDRVMKSVWLLEQWGEQAWGFGMVSINSEEVHQ